MGSTSAVTKPLVPAVPSSVVTRTSPQPRSAKASAPQSLAAVSVPTTASCATPASWNMPAAAMTGVMPMPPATTSARVASLGRRQPLPPGPSTVEPDPATISERRRVPSPTTA